MPRLFTALEIPAPLAFSLSLLRGGLPGARWIDPENYHITLRFIGDIDQRTADEVERRADARRPAELRSGACRARRLRRQQAAFDRRQREGVAGAEGAASRARADHPADRARAGAAKIPPHVTLARIKGASEADAAAYLALRGDFRTPPFPVGRFVLLSSRDSRGGGPYVMEEAYPLAA